MTIRIEWYNPQQTAFYVIYTAGWTWDEHHKALVDLQALRQAHGLQNGLCLFDMRGTMMPLGVAGNKHYFEPLPNSYILLVMDHPISRTLAQIGILTLRKQHIFEIVSTYEEAKTLLDARLAILTPS